MRDGTKHGNLDGKKREDKKDEKRAPPREGRVCRLRRHLSASVVSMGEERTVLYSTL